MVTNLPRTSDFLIPVHLRNHLGIDIICADVIFQFASIEKLYSVSIEKLNILYIYQVIYSSTCYCNTSVLKDNYFVVI